MGTVVTNLISKLHLHLVSSALCSQQITAVTANQVQSRSPGTLIKLTLSHTHTHTSDSAPSIREARVKTLCNHTQAPLIKGCGQKRSLMSSTNECNKYMNKSTHHQHERKKGNNTEANKFLTGGVKKGRKKERTGEWLVLAVTKTRNPKEDSKASNSPPPGQ